MNNPTPQPPDPNHSSVGPLDVPRYAVPAQATAPDYPMMDSMEDGASQHSPFHIQKLLTFLLRFWWIPLITLLLGTGAAVVYLRHKAPTFVSKASLTDTVKVRLTEGSFFAEDTQNFVGTLMEHLKSAKLQEMTLELMKANKLAIPLGEDGKALPVEIRVSQASKSAVYKIEASSSDAAYTQAYLNTLMSVYSSYKREQRRGVSGETLESIKRELVKWETDLKTAQEALTDFQRTNNLVILQEEATVAGGYLTRLKTQLSDYRLERQMLESAVLATNQATVGRTNPPAEFVETPSMLTSGPSPAGTPSERQTASREVELLKTQREKLSKYLRPKHPKIVRLDADIERSERILEIIRLQSRSQLTAALQTLQLKMENVTASIKEWEAKVIEANNRLADADRLKLAIQRNQAVFDRLNAMVQTVTIGKNIDQESVAILDPASLALLTEQKVQTLAMGAMGGLALGVGIVFLIAFRDDRFTSGLEVSERLGEIIVGQVPDMPVPRRKEPLALLELDDVRHSYVESYRSLRSALLYMPISADRPRTLLVTSALPDEGKSTVAANLARTLALGGSRVLLVDSDLRKGQLHVLLGERDEPGLADLLSQPRDLQACIQTNSLPNFSFLSRGSIVPNAGDLLLGPALDQILERLRQQFDYVIFDSSPVFAADDATTLAPKLDGVLFVVRGTYSSARAVREALDLLYQRQARVLGVIFNRANRSSKSYPYYKYVAYGVAKKDH